MRNVNSLLLVSEPEFQHLAESTRTLGEEMGLAAPPAEKAAALYDIVSAGFTDTARAQEVLTAAMIDGKAGLTDAKTAASTLVGVINAYGQENLSAQRASDILFQTIKEGITTFPELAQEIGNVTSIAAAAGISFEEVGAAMATMTVRGIKTPEAVTALRGAITGLLDPAKEVKEKMAELGIEVNASTLKNDGLIKTLEKIFQAADGDTEAIAKMIPNVRALAGVLALMNDGGKGVEQSFRNMKNSAGAARAAFEEQRKSAKAVFEHLKGEILTTAASFGGTFLPALSLAGKMAGSFISGIERLPDAMKGGIAWFGALGAAVLVGTRAYQFATAASRLLAAQMGQLTVSEQANAGAALENAAATTAMGRAQAAVATFSRSFGNVLFGSVGLGIAAAALAFQAYITSMEFANEAAEKNLQKEEEGNRALREKRDLLTEVMDLEKGRAGPPKQRSVGEIQDAINELEAQRQAAKKEIADIEAGAKVFKFDRRTGESVETPRPLTDEEAARKDMLERRERQLADRERALGLRLQEGRKDGSVIETAEQKKSDEKKANVKKAIDDFHLLVSEGELSAQQQVAQLDKILKMEGLTTQQRIQLNKERTKAVATAGREQLQEGLEEIREAQSAEEIGHQEAIRRLEDLKKVKGITAKDIRALDRQIAQERKAERDEELQHELKSMERGVKSGTITLEDQKRGLQEILATHKLTAAQRESVEDKLTEVTKQQVSKRMDAELNALKLRKKIHDADLQAQQDMNGVRQQALEARAEELQQEQAQGKNVTAELLANLQEQLRVKLSNIEVVAKKELETADQTEAQKRAIYAKTHLAQLDALRTQRATLKQMLEEQSGAVKDLSDKVAAIKQAAGEAPKTTDATASPRFGDGTGAPKFGEDFGQQRRAEDAQLIERILRDSRIGASEISSLRIALEKFGVSLTADSKVAGQTDSEGRRFATLEQVRKEFGVNLNPKGQEQQLRDEIGKLDTQIAALEKTLSAGGLTGKVDSLGTRVGELAQAIGQLSTAVGSMGSGGSSNTGAGGGSVVGGAAPGAAAGTAGGGQPATADTAPRDRFNSGEPRDRFTPPSSTAPQGPTGAPLPGPTTPYGGVGKPLPDGYGSQATPGPGGTAPVGSYGTSTPGAGYPQIHGLAPSAPALAAGFRAPDVNAQVGPAAAITSSSTSSTTVNANVNLGEGGGPAPPEVTHLMTLLGQRLARQYTQPGRGYFSGLG